MKPPPYIRENVVTLLAQHHQRYQRSQEKCARLTEGTRDYQIREILMQAQAKTVSILKQHLETDDWGNER